MDDNCGEWVESMGVVSRRWVWVVGGIYGCGYNVYVWLVGVVVRRYIGFLIIFLIPTPLVLALFCSCIPTSLLIFKMFFCSLYMFPAGKGRGHLCIYIYMHPAPRGLKRK